MSLPQVANWDPRSSCETAALSVQQGVTKGSYNDQRAIQCKEVDNTLDTFYRKRDDHSEVPFDLRGTVYMQTELNYHSKWISGLSGLMQLSWAIMEAEKQYEKLAQLKMADITRTADLFSLRILQQAHLKKKNSCSLGIPGSFFGMSKK